MNSKNIVLQISASIPDLPEPKVLDALAYKHNGQGDWEYEDDEHAEAREQVVRMLKAECDSRFVVILRFLLEQEILRSKKHDIITDTMHQLCSLLYQFGDVSDCSLFYRAKFETCFDAAVSLDVEYIFGKNPHKTREYFSRQEHYHPKLLKVLDEYIPNKNWKPL